ncbi:MAG: PH domain-containing protein, partial [bacterium]|nr:PH domain-containing protein [bacterium]
MTAEKKLKSSVWIKRAAMLVILIAAVGAAAPFFGSQIKTSDTSRLLTHRVTKGGLAVVVTEQGTLESSSNLEIKCKVKGGSTVLWVIETGTL